MEEKLLKIINNYGLLTQLKYFQTEVFELNQAIIEYEDEQSLKELLNIKMVDSDISKKKHITEEVADVLVMLLQFVYYYNIDPSEINKVIDYKIERQLNRIDGEIKWN